jgi:hypothetical protein
MRAVRLALLLTATATAAATAQTQPGLTFKIRTQLRNHPVPEKSKPDSVLIRRLAAAAAARADDINTSGDAPPAGGRGNAPAGGGTGTNNVLQMDGSAIKGAHRMDVRGIIGRPELQATEYALFTDTTSTVIDDGIRQYQNRVFDIGSILAFTSAVDNTPNRLTTLKVSWDSLPPEQYEGRQARHYRLQMEYGLLPARPREDSLKTNPITRVTSDYWVEDLPINFENRFAGIGRPRRQVPDSLRGEWQKMLDLYTHITQGTIVKFQATGIIGENGASAIEYTRTMEMTGIRETPLEESLFRFPTDYSVMPRRGRGGTD